MESTIAKHCYEHHIALAEDVSILKTPLRLGAHTVKNRFVFQPMEGCDGKPDGSPDTLTLRRYQRFAKSGAGILWVEAVAVCPEGRANPRQLWLNEENKDAFRRMVEDIRKTAMEAWGFAPLILMQATHSGRQSKPDGTARPIIAYHNALFEKKPLQNEHLITDEECDALPALYAESARLAQECGFDGVDVKCCHAYLLSEFLSAYDRPGPYGGSLLNRTRLYFNCLAAVQQATDQNFIVTTRLNAYDGFPYPYGFGATGREDIQPDLTEAKWILTKLEEQFHLPFANISIGNPYVNPNVNRPFAGCKEENPYDGIYRIQQVTGELQQAVPQLPLVLSGVSYLKEESPAYAAAMIENGSAALAGFGRMTFAYPEFIRDFYENGALSHKKCCVACSQCTKLMRNGGVAGCPVHDRELYGPLYQKYVLKNT